MEYRNAWPMVALGVLLATGMTMAAFVLGGQFKTLGAGRQSITVKGLGEKPVQADLAEWTVGVLVHGERFGDTLENLRQTRPVIDEFLAKHGFPADSLVEGDVHIDPNMVEEFSPQGEVRQVQRGFVGSQTVLVRSKDLQRVTGAYKAIFQLSAEGKSVTYDPPSYLVTDLEAIKMSLIGAATGNARQRAEEFAKVGEVKVGAMRSASQGAFYILAANASSDASDYGGVYDKSTIDKKARVVVTIDYGIE